MLRKLFALNLSILFILSAQVALALPYGDEETYRTGDEWGKKPVVQQELSQKPVSFQRAAYATAHVGSATGFYLGQFNGYYIMATNHHVCPRESACLGKSVNFPLLNLNFTINKFFGHWSDIDLALFAIDVKTQEQSQVLTKVAANFAFNEHLHQDQELITIGFGIGGNLDRKMMANEDSDCRILSGYDEYKFLPDPDELNPADYKAWTFIHGCDVSHGDSGSAMVDRKTGHVLGIVWTGRIPKSTTAQSSVAIEQMERQNDPALWKELNYAVPAIKMKDFFVELLRSGNLNKDVANTLQALIDN